MCNRIKDPENHLVTFGGDEGASYSIRVWWPGEKFRCLGKFKEENHEDNLGFLGGAVPVGTPCNKRSDTCGDDKTMCCGLAAGG